METLDIEALRASGRGPDGRFQPGHLANLRHGLRVAPEHPELVALHRERVEAITADLGGMSQLSAVQRSLVSELARLQIVADSLGADVIDKGYMTSKGRTRAAVSLWLQVVDKQLRLAERLGMERKGRLGGVAAIVSGVEDASA